AVLEIPQLVLGATGEIQIGVPLLVEVLAAASTRQHGEEGVIVPTAELLFPIGQRQEQSHGWIISRPVESDHGFVQATQEEVDLRPQQRVSALPSGSAQYEVTEKLGGSSFPLGQPPHRQSLRGLPSGG